MSWTVWFHLDSIRRAVEMEYKSILHYSLYVKGSHLSPDYVKHSMLISDATQFKQRERRNMFLHAAKCGKHGCTKKMALSLQLTSFTSWLTSEQQYRTKTAGRHLLASLKQKKIKPSWTRTSQHVSSVGTVCEAGRGSFSDHPQLKYDFCCAHLFNRTLFVTCNPI